MNRQRKMPRGNKEQLNWKVKTMSMTLRRTRHRRLVRKIVVRRLREVKDRGKLSMIKL